jgi:hypothetical protein
MAKVKALFFIPKADNDGRSLDAEISELEMELTLAFAGWTCQGYVEGQYKMADGATTKDVNACYFAVMDESRLGELEAILQAFILKTQQEAIYLEIQRHIEFRFVKRGADR